MGKFFNKIRQVFNIFLIMFLIAAVTAVFIFFLTSPEQRNINFWISVGFLGFAMLVETFIASGIAMRFNSGKNIPSSFAKFILGTIYFIFVIAASVWNAIYSFSTTKYILIQIGMLAAFLVPMIFINMMTLRLSGSDRKAQSKGRTNLISRSSKINDLIQDLKNSDSKIEKSVFNSLEKLSDDIKYSDPTPASRNLENSLDEAIENLCNKSKDLNNLDSNEIKKLLTLVERALRDRNNEVLNSK